MGYKELTEEEMHSYTDKIHGDEAESISKEGYELKYPFPIDGGEMDYKIVEDLIQISLYLELKTPYEEHAFLFPAFHRMTKKKYRWLTELMFETHNIPALLVSDSSLLSLYASGRTTGLVLESGHGITKATCMYEGLPISHSAIKNERKFHLEKRIGGSLVTDHLHTLLKKRGILGEENDRETINILDDMKEKYCYVCLDPVSEGRKLDQIKMEYSLPDGKGIILGTERFMAPEIMFNPSLVFPDNLKNNNNEERRIFPVHELVMKSMNQCDGDISVQRDLKTNIVLSGGNTMFEGFADRLNKELISLVPRNHRVRVIESPERKFSVWIGGSILGCISTTDEKVWVMKKEYEENGNRISEVKCQTAICEKEIKKLGLMKDPDIEERLEYVVCFEYEDSDHYFKLRKKKMVLRNLSFEVKSIYLMLM